MGCAAVGLFVLALGMQAPQPGVAGVVRDLHTGRPLARAEVVLPDLGRRTYTDASGRYSIARLTAGPQHVAVRAPGYEQRRLHALVPGAGVLQLDVALRVEPIELPGIAVQSSPARRDDHVADDRAARHVVSGSGLRNHPLLSEPDALQAIAGADVYLAPEAPAGVQVRGGSPDQTAFVLDGIPVFSPYHAGGMLSAWNPDMLARVEVVAEAPGVALPDALSGAIAAETRTPGIQPAVMGALTTTHARVAVDGPLGRHAGFLVSARTGYPGLFVGSEEASYVRGGTSDVFGKIEARVAGGDARVLLYDARNSLSAAAAAEGPVPAGGTVARHHFAWLSRSLGAEWRGAVGGGELQMRAWHARASAASHWLGRSSVRLESERQDAGVLGTLTWNGEHATTTVGARLVHGRTAYATVAGPANDAYTARASTPIASLLAEHARAIGPMLDLGVGGTVALASGLIHWSPRVRLLWRPAPGFDVGGSYARLHQFAQSLRNTDAVVGSIFPADLFVYADAPVLPVGRSDQLALVAGWTAAPGVRLELRSWVRRMRGLLLVAPAEPRPFSAGGYVTGKGSARGVAIDASALGSRYHALLRYGWQHVRMRAPDADYSSPGSAHTLDAGALFFPDPTWSLRASAHAALGRRTTALTGPFEWEACNLLDHGCEFAGAPELAPGTGTTRLPAYVRVDVGARKHWHVTIAGTDVLLGLSGTLTNVMARANVLTRAIDPATGELVNIEMLPFSPLTLSLDWRF